MSIQTDIIMQVIGRTPRDIMDMEIALVDFGGRDPQHPLTPAESAQLSERGITTATLHELGLTPSYNSKVLNLSALLSLSMGGQSAGQSGHAL